MLDFFYIELYKQVINFVGQINKVFDRSRIILNNMNFFVSLVLISIILVLVLIESQITVGWKREGVKA